MKHEKSQHKDPLQMKSAASTKNNRAGKYLTNNRSETIQKKKNDTGLPDKLKIGIENLSGHSMDDVKVHYNSSKPAQLQAHAYAQGTDIHVASGQEKHLPHEAWHVVQQKQGRVKPTSQLKGKVKVNDDAGLEKEADVMGEKAFQLRTSNQTSSHLSNTKISSSTYQLRAATKEDQLIIKQSQNQSIKNIISTNNIIQDDLLQSGKQKQTGSTGPTAGNTKPEGSLLAEPKEATKLKEASQTVGETKMPLAAESTKEEEKKTKKTDQVELDPYLTTVGIESEFSSYSGALKTQGKPFPSHILIAKEGSPSSRLVGIPWTVETDAQSVLEVVSPPLLAPMSEDGKMMDKAWISVVRGKIENGAKAVVSRGGFTPDQVVQLLNAEFGIHMAPNSSGIVKMMQFLTTLNDFGRITKGQNRQTNSQINYRTDLKTYADVVRPQIVGAEISKTDKASTRVEKETNVLANKFYVMMMDDLNLSEAEVGPIEPYILVMAVKLAQLPNTIVDAYRADMKRGVSGVSETVETSGKSGVSSAKKEKTSKTSIKLQTLGSHVKDVTTAWLKASSIHAISGMQSHLKGKGADFKLFKKGTDALGKEILTELTNTNYLLVQFVNALEQSKVTGEQIKQVSELGKVNGVYVKGIKQILEAYALDDETIKIYNKKNDKITEQEALGPKTSQDIGGGARPDTYLTKIHKKSDAKDGEDPNMFLIELRRDENRGNDAQFLAYTHRELAFHEVVGYINDDHVRSLRAKSEKPEETKAAVTVGGESTSSETKDLSNDEWINQMLELHKVETTVAKQKAIEIEQKYQELVKKENPESQVLLPLEQKINTLITKNENLNHLEKHLKSEIKNTEAKGKQLADNIVALTNQGKLIEIALKKKEEPKGEAQSKLRLARVVASSSDESLESLKKEKREVNVKLFSAQTDEGKNAKQLESLAGELKAVQLQKSDNETKLNKIFTLMDGALSPAMEGASAETEGEPTSLEKDLMGIFATKKKAPKKGKVTAKETSSEKAKPKSVRFKKAAVKRVVKPALKASSLARAKTKNASAKKADAKKTPPSGSLTSSLSSVTSGNVFGGTTSAAATPPRLIPGFAPYDGDCLYVSLKKAYGAEEVDTHRANFLKGGRFHDDMNAFIDDHGEMLGTKDTVGPTTTEKRTAEQIKLGEENKKALINTLQTKGQWVAQGDLAAKFVIQNSAKHLGKSIYVVDQKNRTVLEYDASGTQKFLGPLNTLKYKGPVIIQTGNHYVPGTII